MRSVGISAACRATVTPKSLKNKRMGLILDWSIKDVSGMMVLLMKLSVKELGYFGAMAVAVDF